MIKSVARVMALARYPLALAGVLADGQGLQAFGASWHVLTPIGKEATGG